MESFAVSPGERLRRLSTDAALNAPCSVKA